MLHLTPSPFPNTSFELIAINHRDSAEEQQATREKLKAIIPEIIKFHNLQMVDLTMFMEGSPDFDGKVRDGVLETIDLFQTYSTDIPLVLHVTVKGNDIAGTNQLLEAASARGVNRYVLLNGDPMDKAAPEFTTPCYGDVLKLIEGVGQKYTDMGKLHLLHAYVAAEAKSLFSPTFNPAERFQQKLESGLIPVDGKQPVQIIKAGILNYSHEPHYQMACDIMRAAGIDTPIIPAYISTLAVPRPTELLDRDGHRILRDGKPILVDRQKVETTPEYLKEFAGLRTGEADRTAVRWAGQRVMASEMKADAARTPDNALPWVHVYTMNEVFALRAVRGMYPGIDAAPVMRSGSFTPPGAARMLQYA